jgi:integrase
MTKLIGWFADHRPLEEFVSIELRFCGITPSENRALLVGDFDRATESIRIERSQDRGEEGATKAENRERVVLLSTAVAHDVQDLCGIRGRGEKMMPGIKTERALIYQWERALKSLGLRYRGIYQTKHTYATLSLLDGESPAIVARNLGITLATLEKHYAAALQRGRLVRPAKLETPRETPRRAKR